MSQTTQAAYQLMPPLSNDEYAALKASIAAHGIRVPIELDQHGRVIDGHNRLRARSELIAEGVSVGDYPSIIRAGLTEDEKRAHVLMLNLYRRHLSTDARAELIHQLRAQGMTLQAIADAAGVSYGTVYRDIGNEDATYPNGQVEPERTVGKDGKSRPTRYRHRDVVAKTPREAGRAATAIQAAGVDALPVGLIDVRRVERIAREESIAARRADDAEKLAPLVVDGRIKLHHGEFQDELDYVDSGSVDLILTDPPYLAHHVPLYAELAAFAARVLKPGGLLVAYSGQYHLPAVMEHLATHLRYVWTGALVMPGLNVQVRPRGVFTITKPVLMYSNGEYHPPFWFRDTFISTAHEKDAHDWQQPIDASRFFIEQLSRPDWLVCDPFLGAGTNAVAALERGRRFIGCDVDAAAVAATLERLHELAA